MKQKVKQFSVERKMYSVECPKCKREIVGDSETASLYNLKIHLMKHERNK